MNIKLLYEIDKKLIEEHHLTVFGGQLYNYYSTERMLVLMYFWNNLFSEPPKVIFNWSSQKELENIIEEHGFSLEKLKEVDWKKTTKRLVSDNNYIKIDNLIFGDYFIICGDTLLYHDNSVFDKLLNSIILYKQEGRISYACNSKYGVISRTLSKDLKQPFLPENYNSDLPHKQIKQILNSDESGIILLYGDPGTGKTHYIQSLFHELPEKDFTIISSQLLQQLSYDDCVNFFDENKNQIFVLEDCEDIISDSNSRTSALITLLNLSDGIIGRNAKCKFICTFNTNISNIDKALLRKGRLKYKYEFKNLTPDKVVTLGKKLGFDIPCKEMPLCDVYNYKYENGTQIKKKIGF